VALLAIESAKKQQIEQKTVNLNVKVELLNQMLDDEKMMIRRKIQVLGNMLDPSLLFNQRNNLTRRERRHEPAKMRASFLTPPDSSSTTPRAQTIEEAFGIHFFPEH